MSTSHHLTAVVMDLNGTGPLEHGKYLAMDEGNHVIGFMALVFSIRHDKSRAARHAHLFTCSYTSQTLQKKLQTLASKS